MYVCRGVGAYVRACVCLCWEHRQYKPSSQGLCPTITMIAKVNPCYLFMVRLCLTLEGSMLEAQLLNKVSRV